MINKHEVLGKAIDELDKFKSPLRNKYKMMTK